MDSAQLEAYIEEVEQMFIKPSLGDELFLKLLFGNYNHEDIRYKILLDGGLYGDDIADSVTLSELSDDTTERETYGNRYLTGLKTAISYYVYAQNIMTGDYQSTRYGMVVKQNDYSNPLSSKERSDAYNNALEVANDYLRDCVAYGNQTGLIKSSRRAHGSGSVRIRKIG